MADGLPVGRGESHRSRMRWRAVCGLDGAGPVRVCDGSRTRLAKYEVVLASGLLPRPRSLFPIAVTCVAAKQQADF
jgi:hypothetical protein